MYQQPQLTRRLGRRLATYSAVATATAAAGGLASANEVVWDITDITTTDDPTPGTIEAGIFFNMLTGATTSATNNGGPNYAFYDFTEAKFRLDPGAGGYIYGPGYAGGAVGNLGFVGVNVTQTATTSGGGTSTYPLAFASPLAGGAVVSTGQDFEVNGPYYSNFYAYLGFADGQSGNVGIRFDISGSTHYGWAQITRIDTDNFTLHGFGYNDTPGAASTAVDTIDGLALPGDTDGDGDIDDADLGTAFSNFTGPVGVAGGKTAADGDTDGDGDVDDADLANAFSGYTGPLGPANVPEPGSLVLLGLGAAGIAGWRKRHATR